MRDASDPPDTRQVARGSAPKARRYRAAALDWPLLHWLLRCPFLRAADLALFCGLSGSTATRRMEDLERWGLVEWVAPACLTRRGAQRLYYLSNAGLLTVAAALGTDAAMLAQIWGADERRLLTLLPLLPQLVRVQALVGGILAGAPAALGEQGREARGGWHWVRDYIHRFSYRERLQRVRVDAVLALHVTRIRARNRMRSADGQRGSGTAKSGGDESGTGLECGKTYGERRDRWHAAFVLADARIQDWNAAARTLDALLSYREAAERWPVYPTFPAILLLAEDERHAEQWCALARNVADVRRLPPLAGMTAVIPRPPRLDEWEPLDPWRLPWRDLATGAPARPAAVLSPLSFAALPPGVDGRDAPSPLVDPRRVIVAPHPGPRVIGEAFSERMVAATSRGTHSSNGNGGTNDAMRRAERRLLTLHLGGRHLQTLELLFRAPGIRIADLADLLGVQLPSMDRYLSELDRYGLVRRGKREVLNEDAVFITSADVSRGDAAGAHQASHLSFGADTMVRLSADGQRLVAMTQGIGARSRLVRRAARSTARHGAGREGNANLCAVEGADRECEDEGRPRLAVHDAGVFHFFALLARAAANENRRHGAKDMRYHAHRLSWWEVGPLAERRYRYRGSWHNLRPDGAGLYQAGWTRFRFWLEWDQGSMNLANLTRKFETYATYLASGKWRETPDRVVPHLVVVAQSMGQLQRMRRAAIDASAAVPAPAEGRLCASITLSSRLEEVGPLAPIWWPLLPDAPLPSHASSLLSQRIFP